MVHMVHVAVHGARGYLGQELVRLLTAHPRVAGVAPASGSCVGDDYANAVPSYHGPALTFVAEDDPAALDADIAFLAVPDEAARDLAVRHMEAGATVIDLSRAHRGAGRGADGWHYGLADLQPPAAGTRRIANPGCYPTASLLALAPAVQAGLIGTGPIIVDGKSGVSGAGVQPRPHLHFPEANESVTAYRVDGHDHTPEIRGAAARDGIDRPVRFTPHLVPMTRGLQATVYAPLADPATTTDDLRAAYHDAYDALPFVHVRGEANTVHVRGTNHAHVAVTADADAGLLVARGAIDNLLKGGAGTAVQNMNHALGLDATTGLDAPPASGQPTPRLVVGGTA